MNIIASEFFEFRNACSLLYKEEEFSKDIIESEYLIPYIVNGSFCIELGLKAIHKENNKPIKGHSLFMLFDKLDDIEKELLLEKVVSQGNSIDDSLNGLEEMMKVIDLNFINWRYFYEHKEAIGTNWLFIHDLIESIAMRFGKEFGLFVKDKLGLNS